MPYYLVTLAAAALAAYLFWPSPSTPLAPVRARVLDILKEVVPSAYPDERFALLHFDPNKVPAGTTSCGALPGYVGDRLGDQITHYGVPGVRDEGRKRNAWIEPSKKERPLPGDFFITTSDPELKTVMHTGVFVRIIEKRPDGTELWETADAGQAPKGAGAAYVKRVYHPDSNQLTRPDGIGDVRYLGGWVDLEKALASKPSSLKGVGSPELHPCDPAECGR